MQTINQFPTNPAHIEPLFTVNKSNEGSSDKAPRKKRAYQNIELWKRQDLVESITSRRETMKDASERLGINYCTAKHIMKVYRRTGSIKTIVMRKKEAKQSEIKEKVLKATQNEPNNSQLYISMPAAASQVSNEGDQSTENTYNYAFESCNEDQSPQVVTQNVPQMGPYYHQTIPMAPQIYSQQTEYVPLDHFNAMLGDLVFAKYSTLN